MLPVKLKPHLSEAEIVRLCRTEKNAKQLKRFQAILWGFETNLYPNVEKIAKKLCVSKRTVYGWFKDYNDKGLKGILIKKQTGRPRTLQDEEKETFIAEILQSPREVGFETGTWTLKAMVKHLEEHYKKRISLSGVHRMLKREKITRLVPRPMPAKADKKNNGSLKPI